MWPSDNNSAAAAFRTERINLGLRFLVNSNPIRREPHMHTAEIPFGGGYLLDLPAARRGSQQ